MIDFNDYIKEIKRVQEYRNTPTARYSLSDAFDMFRADIRAGEALPYNTGDALPGFDFAALKIEWDAMTRDEQHAAIKGFRQARA